LKILISACCDAADKAGDIARQLVQQEADLSIQQKTGPLDLLTIADLKVQAFIVGSLLSHWPKLHVIGEEAISPQENLASLDLTRLNSTKISADTPTVFPLEDITLYVDPIDGTKDFTEGLFSSVTVLIGIVLKNRPIAGVVYQPWSEDNKNAPKGPLSWGLVGHGIEGLQIKELPVELGLVVAVTRSHPSEALMLGLQKLQPKEVIKVGGCGFKSLLVLQGKVNVYYFPTRGTSKWDTCAPEALLLSVGGSLTDISGAKIDYGRDQPLPNPGIVATLRGHESIIAKLRN